MAQIINEEQDIDHLIRGDKKAFDRLYLQYHKAVHANILKFVKDPTLAEDVLQDVFLSMWQNRFKFEGKDSIGGWLFVVSYNRSLNILRSKLRASIEYVDTYPTDPVASNDAQETEAEHLLQLSLLEEAVNNLPARKKEVFKLCRYEGRSKADVAELLGISQQSVSDYLKQSNAAIREYVSQHYPRYATSALSLLILLVR